MGRTVDVDDLVGAPEIAEILGLSHPNSVTTYFRRYADFPRPVIEKGNGQIRLWLRQEVIEWRDARSRSSDG